LPLLSVSNGVVGLKPVIHIVFESLFNVDIREFCIVVGRGKRVLEDYFTLDTDFVELLESRGLSDRVEELKRFYSMVSQSRIFFVNQPTPRGFGDAVLRAEPFVGDKPFVLHAGDDVVVNGDYDHLKRLFRVFEEHDAVLLLEEVDDPRTYGVVAGKAIGDSGSVLKIVDIVERPEKPPSNLAVVAVYMFKPSIFSYIRRVEPDSRGEIQLTTAIKFMIDYGHDVYGVKLRSDEKRLDVGIPQSYWRALYESYQWASSNLHSRSQG